MILRDKYGYPVETIFGKPVTNLIRRILHTNIRRTLAGESLNEDEIAMKIKPTQSNVALAHSAFAGKTIYRDAAFPSVTITGGAPPGIGPGYCEDSPFSVNRAALANVAATQEQPAGSGMDGIDPSHDWRNILGLLKSTIGLCSDEEPHQVISANLWHAVHMIYVSYGGSPRKVGEDASEMQAAERRVALAESVMKLPYIKATRNAEVGQERFVARDDVITAIHEYAKKARAASE